MQSKDYIVLTHVDGNIGRS